MASRLAPRKEAATVEPDAVAAYVLEEQVGFLLRRVHQHASEVFNEVMRDFDITPTQFAALAKLHDLGPTSQNQLGRLIAMDPATMFGVAGRLAKRGLVLQAPDPNDGRLTVLRLSDEGRALIEAMKSRGVEVSRRTLERLDSEEAATLCRLLAKVV